MRADEQRIAAADAESKAEHAFQHPDRAFCRDRAAGNRGMRRSKIRGLIDEGAVLATAMDVIIDYVDTGFNVLLLMLQVACTGKALGTMDREVLEK